MKSWGTKSIGWSQITVFAKLKPNFGNGRYAHHDLKEKGVAAVSPQTEGTIAQALMVWCDDGGSAGQ